MLADTLESSPLFAAQPVRRRPRFRGPLTTWNELAWANTSARREAKALLFGELAEATRQGMPLDLALQCASQSLEEARRSAILKTPQGAHNRDAWYHRIVTAAYVLFAQFGGLPFMFLAFRMVDVERVARILAIRLQAPVTAGLPLHEAMKACFPDYDPSEVAIMEAGARWGALPDALKKLSGFQVTERRLNMMGASLLYPVWLGGFVMMLVSFMLVFIVPKFKDIYDQLGAELPAPTQSLVETHSVLTSGVVVVFMALGLSFLLLRGLMNGNRISKLLLACVAMFHMGWGLSILFGEYGQSLLPHLSSLSFLLLAFLAACVFLLFAAAIPYLLGGLELTVLRIERKVEPLLKRMPLAGRASRAEANAHWLGALSLALSARLPADEAVRTAGEIAGGRYRKTSHLAASRIINGESIGQACVAENVLSRQMNHRLVLLEGRPDFVPQLRVLADDAAESAFETLNRVGRVVEVFALLALGLISAYVIIALYLPLFNIPRIVGRD